MQVTLINFNPDALDLLLFTKQTRLAQSPGLLDDIRRWPHEKKMAELEYMLGTIQSSWEFCDYTFFIDGVSRAFTHQLVRTRQGSYAQQSQRTVDMSGFEYIMPSAFNDNDGPMVLSATQGIDMLANECAASYHLAMGYINAAYQDMIARGANPQDARGVLPTNVSTNIVAKFNLRTLSEMARLRLCTRTQGEYQDVFRLMREEVIKWHPWAEPFLRVACAATGVCQFPNYLECPIKGPIFNPDTGLRWDQAGITFKTGKPEMGDQVIDARPATRAEIQAAWEQMPRYEAVPKQTPSGVELNQRPLTDEERQATFLDGRR
jgi:flavin-dependent thymidylate synthase